MAKANKAQRTIINRLLKRYGGQVYESEEVIQLRCDGRVIDVATTASLKAALQRLQSSKGKTFVAVTNQEALAEALRMTQAIKVGVMDPHGNVVRKTGKT